MTSVDTNVLARFYVDDPEDGEATAQREVARRLLTSGDVLFVSVTVTLELAWVVRAVYGFGIEDFARVVDHLTRLPNVVVEDRAAVLAATELARGGLDFADALHVARSGHCGRFVTFDDRRLARRASRLSVVPPVELLA